MRKDESTYREYMDRITLSEAQQEKLAAALKEAAGREESLPGNIPEKPFGKKKTLIRRLAPVCMAAAACLLIFFGVAGRDSVLSRHKSEVKAPVSDKSVLYSGTEAEAVTPRMPEALIPTKRMPAAHLDSPDGKNIPAEEAAENAASGISRNEKKSPERYRFLLEGKSYVLDLQAQVFTDGAQTVLLKLPEEVMKKLTALSDATAAELIKELEECAGKAEAVCGEAADPAFWEKLREQAEFFCE